MKTAMLLAYVVAISSMPTVFAETKPEVLHLNVLFWIQSCTSDSPKKMSRCGPSGADVAGENIAIPLNCGKVACMGTWKSGKKLDGHLFLGQIEALKTAEASQSRYQLKVTVGPVPDKPEPLSGISGDIYLNADGTLANRVDLMGPYLNVPKANGGFDSYLSRLSIAPKS